MMKNVAIATDSHSSITPETAQTLGVAVLPMPFTIDGTCYLEEETLTRAEFYAHQRRGAKIATSQPAPADVTALWDKLLTDHDEVVYIPISSGLSGSCQAAMALAADAPYAGRVFVVDNGRVATALHVTVLSFGFKNGMPPEADLVWDVRFLPNPYYVPELKGKTGLDEPVRDYVMNAGVTEEFWAKLTPVVDFLLPQYRQEGRTELVVAVGCTGGRHRSVAVAHRLAAHIEALGYTVTESHRDMGR